MNLLTYNQHPTPDGDHAAGAQLPDGDRAAGAPTPDDHRAVGAPTNKQQRGIEMNETKEYIQLPSGRIIRVDSIVMVSKIQPIKKGTWPGMTEIKPGIQMDITIGEKRNIIIEEVRNIEQMDELLEIIKEKIKKKNDFTLINLT